LHTLQWDDTFTYYNSTSALVFTAKVDAIFRGTEAYMVQFTDIAQYSEVDGRMFVEPSPDSWQLFEGYNLTAIETYWNGLVWLQLSKNNKLVDEGTFYNTFSLINHTTQNTIITGTIKSTTDPVQLTDIIQYYEKTGTVMAQWNSKELNESGSYFVKTLKTSLSLKTPPFASFTYYPENPIVNQTITFNASLSYDQDGNITSYNWNFGDNTNGTGVAPTHIYKIEGVYTVALTVTDNDGETSTTTVNLTVLSGVKGDFNGNGRVDIGDADYVAYMVVGKVPVDLSADFNGNGRVDIGDAAKIAYYLVGKISEL